MDYVWGGGYNGTDDDPNRCYYTEDDRVAVYFNLNPNHDNDTIPNPIYRAICSVPEGNKTLL